MLIYKYEVDLLIAEEWCTFEFFSPPFVELLRNRVLRLADELNADEYTLWRRAY